LFVGLVWLLVGWVVRGGLFVVGLLVGWLVGLLVGWFVGCGSKFERAGKSRSRVVDDVGGGGGGGDWVDGIVGWCGHGCLARALVRSFVRMFVPFVRWLARWLVCSLVNQFLGSSAAHWFVGR